MIKDPSERLAFASSPFRSESQPSFQNPHQTGYVGGNERAWVRGIMGSDKESMVAVGLRLKAIRKGIQLTVQEKPELARDWGWAEKQTWFGGEFGVSRQLMGQYEKGEVKLNAYTLIDICDRTGVPTDWVLRGRTEMLPDLFAKNILKCHRLLVAPEKKKKPPTS